MFKMAALLQDFSKEEQWPVICILWSDVVKTGEIYRRMIVCYVDNCMSQRKVCKWVKGCKGGQTSIPVDVCCAYSYTVTCVEVKVYISTSRTTEESALMKLHLK
jgi:hypothetical protein